MPITIQQNKIGVIAVRASSLLTGISCTNISLTALPRSRTSSSNSVLNANSILTSVASNTRNSRTGRRQYYWKALAILAILIRLTVSIWEAVWLDDAISKIAVIAIRTSDIKAKVNTKSSQTFLSDSTVNVCAGIWGNLAQVLKAKFSAGTLSIGWAIVRDRDTNSIVAWGWGGTRYSLAPINCHTNTILAILVVCTSSRDCWARLFIVIHDMHSVNSARLAALRILNIFSYFCYSTNSINRRGCRGWGWAFCFSDQGIGAVMPENGGLDQTAKMIILSEANSKFACIITVSAHNVITSDESA